MGTVKKRGMLNPHDSGLRMPTSDAMFVLETLLEPHERFDGLCTVARSGFGRSVVDLSCSNPCNGPDDEVRRALRLAIEDEKELGSSPPRTAGGRSRAE